MNQAAAPARQLVPAPAVAPASARAPGAPNPIRDDLNDLKFELRAQSIIKLWEFSVRAFTLDRSRLLDVVTS